jgi:hypothetical protein
MLAQLEKMRDLVDMDTVACSFTVGEAYMVFLCHFLRRIF